MDFHIVLFLCLVNPSILVYGSILEGPVRFATRFFHRFYKEDIKIIFYHTSIFDMHKEISIKDIGDIFTFEEFIKTNPSVLYIHGYRESSNSDTVEAVVMAYKRNRPKVNVFAVDWSVLASGSYSLHAAPNTLLVGEAVAKSLVELISKGFNLNKLHIIGHSLGSQVAGNIGKELIRQGHKAKRITGLDPALPMFYPGPYPHIEKTDADLVDIIHTNPWAYGTPFDTGKADFWPNLKRDGIKTPLQPGCGILPLPVPLTESTLCSHQRSVHYYAESLDNPKGFPAADGMRTVYMGVDCSPDAKGVYVLYTNSEPPFAKGKAGLPDKAFFKIN